MFGGRENFLSAFGATVKLIARALLAVLALTGCSATATRAPSATPALSMVKPTEAQKTALMTDLTKVKDRRYPFVRQRHSRLPRHSQGGT